MAGGSQNRTIGKLDFPEPNQRTPLLHENHNDGSSTSRQPSPASTRTGRFFQDVAEGIQAKDREALKRETLRYVSFFWAVVCWYATRPSREERMSFTNDLTAFVPDQSQPFPSMRPSSSLAYITPRLGSTPSPLLQN